MCGFGNGCDVGLQFFGNGCDVGLQFSNGCDCGQVTVVMQDISNKNIKTKACFEVIW